MIDSLKKIMYIFDAKQKISVFFIIVLVLVGGMLEMIGVTAIIPFIDIVMDSTKINSNKWLSLAYNMIGAKSPNQFLIFMAYGLIIIYIIKNIYLTFMNYIIFRFTYDNQYRLSVSMLRTYLNQPYLFYLDKSSAALIRNVSDDTSMFFDTVLATIQLFVEIVVCAILLVVLINTDKTITIAVAVLVVGGILLVVRTLKHELKQRGLKVRTCREGMSKWLIQSFESIKDIKIGEKENFFLGKYQSYYSEFAKNHCAYQVISYIPKPLMETICIGGVLGIVAVKMSNGTAPAYFISTLSVFAVASFRLLPSFNRITGYLSRIMFNHSAVDSVYEDLIKINSLKSKQDKDYKEKLVFNNSIEIKDIHFTYPERNVEVLSGINLAIQKNKSIAFIGPSGAGKTTLADILLGILQPQKGTIAVDKQDVEDNMTQWHGMIGYIPQTINLLDDSIKNNIAFGISENEINEKRIYEVMKEAQLTEFVSNLEKGIETVIGEKGVRLSGGQRQRIGIARALYNNPEVLVLDEATSALDNDTEKAVMDAIDSLNGKKTLIIIAHRLSTIKNCDYIYEIKDGNMVLKEGKL